MSWGPGIQEADVALSSSGRGTYYWHIEYLNMIGRERGSQSYAMLGASKKKNYGVMRWSVGIAAGFGVMRGQSSGDRLVVSNLNVSLI